MTLVFDVTADQVHWIFFQVFNKRLFSIYRIANPPFGPDNGRDLELVYTPRADGNLDESWDTR